MIETLTWSVQSWRSKKGVGFFQHLSTPRLTTVTLSPWRIHIGWSLQTGTNNDSLEAFGIVHSVLRKKCPCLPSSSGWSNHHNLHEILQTHQWNPFKLIQTLKCQFEKIHKTNCFHILEIPCGNSHLLFVVSVFDAQISPRAYRWGCFSFLFSSTSWATQKRLTWLDVLNLTL